MARRLNGINPLAYMGVRPVTPAQMVVNRNRRPTTTDLQNFALGTWWIIPTRSSAPSNEVWILINKTATVATWIEVDHGGGQVVPGNQYTLLTADGSGAYGPNIGPGTAGQLLVSQGATGNPAFVTPTAGTGLTLTANAGTIEYALDGPVTVDQGGTSKTSFDPYAVVCGGTGSTTALQQVSGTGTTGQVLTAQSGALPIWSDSATSGEIIVTEYVSGAESGTHTLNNNTKLVAVCAIGGGQGGFDNRVTGGFEIFFWGGSGGSYVFITQLASFFGGAGANVSYGVGAGGAPNTNGGDTFFGNIVALGGRNPEDHITSGIASTSSPVSRTPLSYGNVQSPLSTLSRIQETGAPSESAAYFNNLQYYGKSTVGFFGPTSGGSVQTFGEPPYNSIPANGGTIYQDTNLVIWVAGGEAGTSVSIDGKDGNQGVGMMGGTGGGAGIGGEFATSNGGNGGFPGGGGGARGKGHESSTGTHGSGADGAIWVIEYL